MAIMLCPHCGTSNRAGANFCNGCGTDLREPDRGRTRTPRTPSPERPDPPQDAPAPAAPLRVRRPRPQDTPPAEPPIAEPPASVEPWLRLDFSGEGQPPPPAGTQDPIVPPEADDTRLVTGIQGLLTPIRVATNIGDDDPVATTAAPATPLGHLESAGPEESRLLRTLLSEPPSLAAGTPHPRPWPPRNLRSPWLFALLAALIGIPVLMGGSNPGGTPIRLPGVVEAHAAIQSLPADTPVLVYWAYDPANAGELDLVMQPVMRHLLLRRARPAVISPLPGGPATAQRLLTRVRSGLRPGDLALAADLGQPVTYTYLPGGAATLPLIVRDSALAGVPASPGLVVVAAAQAEEVQHWLEQVQPLQRIPVIAVTAAGADPILRPYRDSGQLVGLVSGFDGGHAYTMLMDPFAEPDSMPELSRHLALQNWGQVALLAAIVLGNLAALLSRDGDIAARRHDDGSARPDDDTASGAA